MGSRESSPATIALSAEERVDIYANMYFYRLLEVLQEDFPATLAMIGAERFHNLITGYLIEYPPAHFSISYAGKSSRGFHSATIRLREEFPFLADLAQMERALIEVFHARRCGPARREADARDSRRRIGRR